MSQNMLFDDPVFPVTPAGMRAAGMVLESAKEETPVPDAIAVYAEQQTRSQAMSAVLAWIEDGEFTYTALDEYVVGIADLGGDFEIGEEEEAIYNRIWAQVPDALLTLGAGEKDVDAFVNEENEGAAARIGKEVSASMNENEADDEEIIIGFALGEEALFESASDDPQGRFMILEAAYKRKKVVHDGKVQVVFKKVSGTVRRSTEQKLSLKKAQRKSHSGAANLERKKSMRARKRRGM